MHLEIKDVLELVTLCFLILGSTWKLSSQIAAISTKLDEHCKADAEKFEAMDTTLNDLAPRVIRLPDRRR